MTGQTPEGMSVDQLQRLVVSAELTADGLCDLLNALHRELGDEIQPFYRLSVRLTDGLGDYRASKGWSA